MHMPLLIYLAAGTSKLSDHYEVVRIYMVLDSESDALAAARDDVVELRPSAPSSDSAGIAALLN